MGGATQHVSRAGWVLALSVVLAQAGCGLFENVDAASENASVRLPSEPICVGLGCFEDMDAVAGEVVIDLGRTAVALRELERVELRASLQRDGMPFPEGAVRYSVDDPQLVSLRPGPDGVSLTLVGRSPGMTVLRASSLESELVVPLSVAALEATIVPEAAGVELEPELVRDVAVSLTLEGQPLDMSSFEATLSASSAEPGVVAVEVSDSGLRLRGREVGQTTVRVKLCRPDTSCNEELVGVDLRVEVTRIFVGLDAGGRHSCARTQGGVVWCWGAGLDGQLGNGSLVNIDRPIALTALSGAFSGVAAGDRHSCALSEVDGGPQCWGSNDADQLGVGATVARLSNPRAVTMDGFERLWLGVQLSCASSEGRLWCWGDNASARIRDDGLETVAMPTRVEGIEGDELVDVAIGDSHLCAATRRGSSVSCRGDEEFGRLGPAPGSWSFRGARVLRLAAGATSSCALLDDGDVQCWGSNGNGQLGRGATSVPAGFDANPSSIDSAVRAVALSGQGLTFCMVAEQGADVVCWGGNPAGQIVQGPDAENAYAGPRAVELPEDVRWKDVSVGGFHVCALSDAGQIYCWGANNAGQLGIGRSSLGSQPASQVR